MEEMLLSNFEFVFHSFLNIKNEIPLLSIPLLYRILDPS